jgi:hypothetical protein
VHALDQHVAADHVSAVEHRRIVADAEHQALARPGNGADAFDQFVLW